MFGARVFAIAGALLLVPSHAFATGFADIGQDITPREDAAVKLSGYLRTRAEALSNLDLDRGPTPSGQLLFPVSLSEPARQTFTHFDMRLRTDVAAYAPGGMVAVKARVDVLDNLTLGSAPDGIPSATTTQRPPGAADAFRVKRAYGEALLPFGLVAAGRMGAHWGLGMVVNGGDCADCDSGDAADRLALLVPTLGHIFAVAYDISAIGPLAPRGVQGKSIGFEPSTNVQSLTFAILQYKDEFGRLRRARTGKETVEYGSYVAYRWQSRDVPSTYLPSARPVALTASQVMDRGFSAGAVDAWARVTGPWGRVEAEGAYLFADVEQSSLLPGALLHTPASSRQLGAALVTDFGALEGRIHGGLDAGYASGDPAPGFGVRTPPNAAPPRPGDFDGPQASPPLDHRVDNFRFHPDFRIDRVLFREIIGTVTDAVYLRPHGRFTLTRSASGEAFFDLAGVASWAVQASSAPGEEHALGIEIDPTLAYESKLGFAAALEQGTLVPLAGLDNPRLGLTAKTAQVWRVRLAYVF
jgi:uncharacterized protein (TIGR04551 family)